MRTAVPHVFAYGEALLEESHTSSFVALPTCDVCSRAVDHCRALVGRGCSLGQICLSDDYCFFILTGVLLHTDYTSSPRILITRDALRSSSAHRLIRR